MAVSTADLITPHPSPKVTPSPQAPQREDTGVQTKFCTDIAQSSGTRNAMVYSNVTNRDTGKFSAALALREAAMVSSATSTPGTGNHRIRDCLNSPLKKRETTRFPPRLLDTGTPAISVSVGALNRL